MQQLNRLIIIGNGFDLSIGLRTGYQDFMTSYLKGKIRDVLDQGKVIGNGWEFGAIRIEELRSTLRENNPFQNNIETLKKELESIENLQGFQREALSKRGFQLIMGSKLINRLMHCDTWGDIERSYFESVIEVANRQDSGGDRFESEQSILNQVRRLNTEFDELKEALFDYLTIEEQKGEELIREKKERHSVLFDKVLTGESFQGATKDCVLNFNYTSTAFKCLEDATRRVEFINIHGTILKGIKSIVFGYGDDLDNNYRLLEDYNHPEYLRHFKSHRYSQNDSYSRLLNFIDDRQFEVHVIGHSCGISDRTMLKTIFEHKYCLAIKNYHFREGEEALKDHFEKDINVSRHFDNKVKKRQVFKFYDSSLRY